MSLLDTTAADSEFDTLGGPLVDTLESTFADPSPYRGTLPWVTTFKVHEAREDGRCVVTVTEEDGTELVRIEDDARFQTLPAIFTRIEELLGLEPPHQFRSVKELRARLASKGYRWTTHPTGRTLGHVSTHTLVADSISELDAALQLRAAPETLYDIIDAGADPMRCHVIFGTPYTVAMALAGTRPDYWEVVFYMRAHGAY